jgi:hypothetical protein
VAGRSSRPARVPFSPTLSPTTTSSHRRGFPTRRADMLSSSQRTAHAVRRLAAGMATAAERIGDTKVAMSLLEKGAYINYQRIDDNLEIVRRR